MFEQARNRAVSWHPHCSMTPSGSRVTTIQFKVPEGIVGGRKFQNYLKKSSPFANREHPKFFFEKRF
jgi:hypothetical protein